MSAIGEVNSTASAANQTIVNSNITQELGEDEFLKLLVTELQNQDPSNPMDNKDFITQMAQFSSLQQIQNMSSTLENYLETQTSINNALMITQSAALIGKNVLSNVDDNSITGKVESIVVKDSVPYAVIGENTVPVSSISKLSEENLG